MKVRFAKALATFFYVGEFPVAPGTLASAVGILLVACSFHDLRIYVALTFAITAVGIWACDVTEKAVGKKDPGCCVIDEVAGIMVSFFLVPLSWPVVVTGFFLFRAFDMFKIYPANKLEDMGGGFGIMADDLAAGLYTNLVLQIAIRLAHI